MVDDLKMEDIHEPQHAPDGRIVFQVTKGEYRDTRSNNAKAPEKEGFFMLRPVEPIELEDEDAEWTPDAYSPEFHKIPVWQNQDQWNVVRFLNTLGISREDMAGATLKEAAPAAKGRFFVANFRVKPPKGGSEYEEVELSGFAPYENGAAS